MVLMVAVIVVQMGMATHLGLSPWLGGGFGMFSTLDSPAERALLIVVGDAFVQREMTIPPGLEDASYRAIALPTNARLERLANQVAARYRTQGEEFQWVEVQVWRHSVAPAMVGSLRIEQGG